ncbi:hypothetical protein TrLO_g9005 [Triparma laevis f. longispina]|uniref:Uncharacterized protein n=1 Tax=Triparma laevis f. longispina TaxID=1714387 RepID=A0A9W7FEI1_9STRA|nr:hypothetical protein TrLO_g9005 [Triparma laevis f. longispina]
MSKSVASESKDGHETLEMSERGGGEDEGEENEEGILDVPPASGSPISTTVSTAPAATNQFMHTHGFRRHFIEFVHVQTLMVLRVTTKGWKAVAEALIDEGVKSGELMVHDGNDASYDAADARQQRCKLATRVVFLLNITKVGDYACMYAANLVVVDILEGVQSIGRSTFERCKSSTTVSFLTMLTSIGSSAFRECTSLENVDILHTNLQELCNYAFERCKELKSITIPDSLQTLGYTIVYECAKLVPSNIYDAETKAVVAHLRSLQNN